MTGVKATTNKVVPNHGKPNCAPKPPGIQHIVSAHKNGLSPLNTVNSTTTNNGNINRPIVSRAHSMRSPRFVHRPIFDKIHTHTYTPQNRLNFKKLISVPLLVFGAELAEALIAHKLQTNGFSFFFSIFVILNQFPDHHRFQWLAPHFRQHNILAQFEAHRLRFNHKMQSIQ